MFAELLKIINQLLPLIHPDEADKIQARIDKLKEKRDVDYKKALEKLVDISPPASILTLNILFSELHDSL